MIFTARQLQEKCQEQTVDIYMIFVDLTKAFDTVSRDRLWKIMAKFGCPPRYIEMVRQFHDSMQARVQNDGEYSESFLVQLIQTRLCHGTNIVQHDVFCYAHRCFSRR